MAFVYVYFLLVEWMRFQVLYVYIYIYVSVHKTTDITV